MEFQLLGPIEVIADGQVISLGTPKQRALLCALLIDAGRPVLPETLIERVWGGGPPRVVRNALYSYATRIRHLLASSGGTSARLVRRSGGYVLEVDPDQVDLLRWQRLVGMGRSPDLSARERAEALREGLALWRGEPLAGVDSAWAEAIRRDLTQQRITALTAWGQLEINLGHYDIVIDKLAPEVARHPLVETLIATHIRALYLSGRASEALSCYAICRRHIADELGSEPGDELRDVHTAMLRGELPRPRQSEALIGATPRQLPIDVSGFTGRIAEIQALDLLVDTAQRTPSVVISAVSGTAGVGKTALAVHWAHRVAARFPDGQLYVDLRGYDQWQPLPATEALAAFLRALGVENSSIPTDQTERAALYRTILADRRMLVVLDNAANMEQVRDLLPGGPTCLSLVTSRDRLAALVARYGARRLDLDLFSTSEAVQLLVSVVGERIGTDVKGTKVLIKQCARLPLALRIAAEYLVAHPATMPGDLAEEIANEQRGLDLLNAGGDEGTAIRSVFAWSYRNLSDAEAHAFRLLGLALGQDIECLAAAALLDVDPALAKSLLDALARANLIREAIPGRFSMHDLLRMYARELADRDVGAEQRTVVGRQLDYYLRGAAKAMNLLEPFDRPTRPNVDLSIGLSPSLSDLTEARCWLDANRANIVAAGLAAEVDGWPRHAISIASTTFKYLQNGAHFADASQLHHCAIRAAIEIGDRQSEAVARRHLAMDLARTSRHEEADEQMQQTLAILAEVGNRRETARVLMSVGNQNWYRGRYHESQKAWEEAARINAELEYWPSFALALSNLTGAYAKLGLFDESIRSSERAIGIYTEMGDDAGIARALGNIGQAYLEIGRYEEALDYTHKCLASFEAAGNSIWIGEALGHLAISYLLTGSNREALEIGRRALAASVEVRDRNAEAIALDVLGRARHEYGQYGEAAKSFGEALDIAVQIGDRSREASALNGLAGVLLATGRPHEALTHFHSALAVSRTVGDRFGEARALDGTAQVAYDEGRLEEARDNWQASRDVYAGFNRREAERVQQRLAETQVCGEGS